jgi:hypothetical protein
MIALVAGLFVVLLAGWPSGEQGADEDMRESLDRMEEALRLLAPLRPPPGFDGLVGPGALPGGVSRERVWPVTALLRDTEVVLPRPLLPDPRGRALVVTVREGGRVEIRSCGDDGIVGGGRSPHAADDHARAILLDEF